MDVFHLLLRTSRILNKYGGGKIIYRFMRVYYCCDIPPSIICNGVYFCHEGFGCLFNSKTIIGSGTKVQHGVTIGEVHGKVPIIGKNCYIGARSIIIGGIHIGDNVTIGAGSVVVKSVPDNCVIAGNPARIIRVIEEGEKQND